ncbi:MAG: hypothetical protein QW057_00730 [Candidatus Bathyarchaeia archaeon]
MSFTPSPSTWASIPLIRRSFGDRGSARREPSEAGIIFVIALAIGLAVIAIIAVRFVRVQRGLLGPILAVAAAALLVYWLRELLIPSRPRWLFDILEDENEITLVAEVPGPEDEVEVKLEGRRVVIKGGGGFRRTVKLGEKAEIIERSYVNGVLNLRLRRLKVSAT